MSLTLIQTSGADHFSLEVSDGTHHLVFDGLSGMVPDDEIESIVVSNVITLAKGCR